MPPPVEVDEPPVEVEVDTPPFEDEVPPLEVEEPPVEVNEPPVEVTPPVVVLVVEPVVVVEIATLPTPLLPPPPKKPPKKPPPKPNPPEPPITVTSPPPWEPGIGGMGGSGIAIGTMANCGCSGARQGAARRMIRRAALGLSAWHAVRMIRRLSTGAFARATGLIRACLTYWTWAAGASATCTAPPPIKTPPAASADIFTRAIRTDISSALFALAGTDPAAQCS